MEIGSKQHAFRVGPTLLGEARIHKAIKIIDEYGNQCVVDTWMKDNDRPAIVPRVKDYERIFIRSR